MKINITLKDPDTLYDAIREAVEADIVNSNLVDEEEKTALKELRVERFTELASKWFKYGEYVTLVMDTEEKSIVVKENGSNT